MSQTTINAGGQPIGLAGQVYDSQEVLDIPAFFNTGTASIPFGCAVALDTANEKGGKAIVLVGDKIIGINVFSLNHMPAGTSAGQGDIDSVGLVQNAGGQLGRKGRFLVPIMSGVTIAIGDRCWCTFESDGGSNTQIGVWSNANTGSHCIDLTKIGVFKSATFVAPTVTGGSANVAVLEVDFTSLA